MKCLCGCKEKVNEGRRYINGSHSLRGKTPWNKKYPNKWKCEYCSIMFKHNGHKRRFCSPKCFGKSKKGSIPWNKGLKGRQPWHDTSGLIDFKKGNTLGFKKGHIPWHKGKKTGIKPWNYIDGRSKKMSPARYGDDWSKIRLMVYKRDNWTCQYCSEKMSNIKIAHHIHHKIPFLVSFDNSLDNLITLCKSCHSKEEMNLMKKKRN